MPITKRQFELGINNEIDALMKRVYDFLNTHRDLAYNRDELEKEVGGGDSNRLPRALEVLVTVGAAEAGWVRNDSYYAFANEIDTKTWERKVPV